MLRFYFLLLLLAARLLASPQATAYSILTHQANVDSTWARCLLPTLQAHYPGGTDDELREAKAYAYGGAIIQDMGYYPFGSALFTNLTHYVRSGDFVHNLLAEAKDRNEYAFALGAMAHYAADIKGHGQGTNKVVPVMFPELEKKFGPVVTYEQAPTQHSQAEFAFDVVQMAAGRYRSNAYHVFIGFMVSKDVLERAFLRTYGLHMNDIIFNVDLSIASYRFAVRQLIPLAGRAAWRANRHEIRRTTRGARRREYVYHQSKSDYKKEYGRDYEHPRTGAKIVAVFLKILPKVGPLKALKFVAPSAAAQKTYRASFGQTVSEYCVLLNEQEHGRAQLPNMDFDTGHDTKFGEYGLADKTYGEWLRKLDKEGFKHLTPTMRTSLLSFFATAPKTSPNEEEQEADTRRETAEALAHLQALPTSDPAIEPDK